MPENRDSQARRVVRSHTHGEPILPPNFRRRVAGVPPVRREALRVGCGFSFSRADVKTPEFRGSFSLKLLEHYQICASRRIKGGKLKAILKYISQNKRGEAESYTKVHFSELRQFKFHGKRKFPRISIAPPEEEGGKSREEGKPFSGLNH